MNIYSGSMLKWGYAYGLRIWLPITISPRKHAHCLRLGDLRFKEVDLKRVSVIAPAQEA